MITDCITMGIKEDLGKRVVEFFTGYGFSSFLGGSVRFGLHTAKSDVDVVVYVRQERLDFFMNVLAMSGYTHRIESGSALYSNPKINIAHLGEDVDLIMIDDYGYYMNEYNNHVRLMKLLTNVSHRPYNNENLRGYYRHLKDKGVKGAIIYQMLVTVITAQV